MNNLAEETESKYPEILVDLRDGLTEILIEAGADAAKAKSLAFTAAERIRKRWAGIAVYIPRGRDWALSQRDCEIYRRYAGHNKHQLCREYGITEQRLYQIVAKVGAEETARRQINLFD